MNTYCDQLRVHRLYIGLENQAWLYEVKDDTVVRTAVPELQCQQREADSRLVWHANHISEKQPYCKLVIQCDDTDILLNMLPHDSSFNIHVWMDVGKSSNNTRRYIRCDRFSPGAGSRLMSGFAWIPPFHWFRPHSCILHEG